MAQSTTKAEALVEYIHNTEQSLAKLVANNEVQPHQERVEKIETLRRLLAEAQKDLARYNTRSKTRPVNQPYEVWSNGRETFQVLKCYQSPTNEAKNVCARRLVAYDGPYETDRAGHDMYLNDLKRRAVLVWSDTSAKTMPAKYTI